MIDCNLFQREGEWNYSYDGGVPKDEVTKHFGASTGVEQYFSVQESAQPRLM
jgi:hypothetical protein